MPPTMAPAARTSLDDFDMAKLQKTLAQRQRHAVRNSAHVAKLTPAEIRSLNNDSLVSKTGSQSSTRSTSTPSRSRRSTNATPPTTPDVLPAYQAQAHRNSVSRNNSLNIPTPPHTPSGHRRHSQSSTHSHHYNGHTVAHGHTNGVIHAPRPRGSVQAAFMSANGPSSRPSSSGSSTYRGLPTYRGPEVTRTGSKNMLQYPSQQIVNNPLSYFSRPRQSMLSTSPDQSRRTSVDVSIYRAQSLQNGRANSLPYVSAPSSRQPSPPRVTDSPVSMMIDDTERFSAFDPADDPHNQPKSESDGEGDRSEPRAIAIERKFQDVPAPVAKEPKEVPSPESPKKQKDKQKRFTIHAALFGGEKTNPEVQENKLKKTRPQTLSLPKNELVAKAEEREPLVIEETRADAGASGSDDFPAHPGVRPLSIVIPGDFKGKDKEEHSGDPVYGRCACCGKIKRPHGFNNELSPVLENENLRTNFSFEVDRTSGSSGRRSSDASRHKFTPIIPMQVGENETRQARVAEYTRQSDTIPGPQEQVEQTDMEIASSSPVRQSLRQNASPIRLKRNSAPPRFTRFASLHGRPNGDTGPIAEEEEEFEADEDQPLMEHADFYDPTVQTHDFATMSGAVQENDITNSQYLPEISSAARAVVDPLPSVSTNESLFISERTQVESNKPSNRSSLDAYYTPGQGTPATEEHAHPVPTIPSFHQAATNTTSPRLPDPSLNQTHFVSASPTELESNSLISNDDTTNSSTSTPTTITITEPTSASTTGTSVSASSAAFEQELSASFRTPNGTSPMDLSLNPMDQSLRPKFSFESMRSAVDVEGEEKGTTTGPSEKAMGKRRSMASSGWLNGLAVKA